jgi:hypothetical protein
MYLPPFVTYSLRLFLVHQPASMKISMPWILTGFLHRFSRNSPWQTPHQILPGDQKVNDCAAPLSVLRAIDGGVAD